jgi:hypothetical protein
MGGSLDIRRSQGPGCGRYLADQMKKISGNFWRLSG